MFVWIKKIGQVALLLVVLLALIGVNVKQVYCCHAHDLHREVIFVPDEAAETCHEGCCGSKSCHHTTRYDFYKVTDYSQVETDTELFIFSFELMEHTLPEVCGCLSYEKEVILPKEKWPDRNFQRSFLCSYLC